MGIISSGPDKILFFGINTCKNYYMTIKTDTDEKINSLSEDAYSRACRFKSDQQINDLEKSFFALTKSSLVWIVTAASPFCSFLFILITAKNGTKVDNFV